MDLSKLTPAPWSVHDAGTEDHTICKEVGDGRCYVLFDRIGGCEDTTDADFIVLARAAFDVMTRRGWYAVPRESDARTWIAMNAFCVAIERGGNSGSYFVANDPFTCLVEADEWYRQDAPAERSESVRQDSSTDG